MPEVSCSGQPTWLWFAVSLLMGCVLFVVAGVWVARAPPDSARGPAALQSRSASAMRFESPPTPTPTPTPTRATQRIRTATLHFSPAGIPRDLLGALETGETSFDDLLARVPNDAQLRDELQARYLEAQHPILRKTLLALLAAGPAAEALALTERLLADRDPVRRIDGYQMLADLPLDNDSARHQVLRALRGERDSAALGALLGGLQPGLMAAEDAESIASYLLQFSEHEDPQVRARVLPQMAQWADVEQLEAPYFNALADSNAEVRGAAIAGIAASTARSPRLRGALFDLAADVNEDPEHRHAALQVLLRFRLTRSEVELYRLLETEVPLHPAGG